MSLLPLVHRTTTHTERNTVMRLVPRQRARPPEPRASLRNPVPQRHHGPAPRSSPDLVQVLRGLR